ACWAAKKEGRRGDIFGRTDGPERCALDEVLTHRFICKELAKRFGLDRATGEGVDADLRSELIGHEARHMLERRFRRAVGDESAFRALSTTARGLWHIC